LKRNLRIVLAQNVLTYRKAHKMSQDEFAASCGLHRTYIGSVERCERNVTLATLELLARSMRVSAADLLTEGKVR